jgi:hypothetical protein
MLLVSSLCHLGLLAPLNPSPIITRQGYIAGQGDLTYPAPSNRAFLLPSTIASSSSICSLVSTSSRSNWACTCLRLEAQREACLKLFVYGA